MERVLRFFRRIIFFYKRSSILADWKNFIIIDLVTPSLQMLCFSLIGYYVYGAENIFKWMIGNTLLISSFGALYRVGLQIFNEKSSGTLSLLIATKTKLAEVFFSSAVFTMITSFFSVGIGVTLLSFLFNISWSIEKICNFCIVLIFAIFSVMCFGFLFSCFILVTTEIHLVINTTERILLIFTGANFSTEQLPVVLKNFSSILPLTNSIKAAQRLLKEENILNSIDLIKNEFMIGIIYLLIGIIILGQIEKIAIKNGNIDII